MWFMNFGKASLVQAFWKGFNAIGAPVGAPTRLLCRSLQFPEYKLLHIHYHIRSEWRIHKTVVRLFVSPFYGSGVYWPKLRRLVLKLIPCLFPFCVTLSKVLKVLTDVFTWLKMSVDYKLPKFDWMQNEKHKSNNNHLKDQNSSLIPHGQKGYQEQMALQTSFSKLPRSNAIDWMFMWISPPQNSHLEIESPMLVFGALGRWFRCKGRAFMNGISDLIKETPQSFFTSSAMWRQPRSWAPTRHLTHQCLDPRFSKPPNCEK